MVEFFFLWLFLQVALVAADPFGNLDMAEILLKKNRHFNRVLNHYFPEDGEAAPGGEYFIKSSYVANSVVIENLFFPISSLVRFESASANQYL